MKHKQLYLRMKHDQLEATVKKYHFDSEPDVIFHVYADLIHCIRPFLYYKYESGHTCIGSFVITLGNGPDDLLDRYEAEGKLSQGYAIECICLELFRVAYKQVAEFVRREQRQILSQMIFLDIEQLPSILDEFHKEYPEFPVFLNDASNMIPSQSVVFRGISSNTTASHDCSTCDSTNCPFRQEPVT